MTERRKAEPGDPDWHDEHTAEQPPAPGGPLPEREQDLEHKTDWESGTHE